MKWFESLFAKHDPHYPIHGDVVETISPSEGVLDAYSQTWIFVSNWLEAELVRMRESNDSTKLTDIQTAVLRGKIRFAKDLLALPDKKERKRSVPQEEDY